MREIATFVCATIFSCFMVSSAVAEHTVGNGGGFGEEQVLFALHSFGRASDICRDTRVYICQLTPAQGATLAKIREMLPTVTAPTQFFAFAAESDESSPFPKGRGVKFVTERRVGAPIVVNRTLLYRPTGTGFYVPINLEEAYGWIAQILAYQVSDLAADEAFDLGTRIGGMIQARAQDIELGRVTDDVTILDPKKRIRMLTVGLEGPDQGMQFARTFVQDSETMHEITIALSSKFDCKDGASARYSFGHLRPHMTYSGSRLTIELSGEVRYVCPDDPALLNGANARLAFALSELVVSDPVGPNDRAFRYRSDSLALTLTPRP